MSHKQNVAWAILGLGLALVGLILAALSDPARFSIDVADDRYIHLFAVSGFGCTLIGTFLFLFSVRNATSSMSPQLQRNANIGVGLGFVLQLVGFFLPEFNGDLLGIGLAIIIAGLAIFVWGTIHFAKGKGYSTRLGLLGILGISGLIVLILLPHLERHGDAPA